MTKTTAMRMPREAAASPETKRILVVDDEPDIRRVVLAKLRAAGYAVEMACDGAEALRIMEQDPHDVVLLDVMMPEMSGIEVCRRLRDDPRHKDVYVIMVTAKGQVDDRVCGLDAGADDYVAKPFDLDELLARIRAGERRHEEAKELKEQAIRDGLTGLYAKQVFWAFLEKEFYRARRYDYPMALIVLDLDKFKAVNDAHGHLVGDEVLKGLAHVLEACMRRSDIAVRFGGDEFVLLLPQTGGEGARILAERIREAVEARPADADGHPIAYSVSLGVTATDVAHVETPEDLFALADAANRAAKHAGRNAVRMAEKPPHAAEGGAV